MFESLTIIREKHYIDGNLRGNKKVIWDPIGVTAGIIFAVVLILSIYIQNSGAVTNLLMHDHVSLNVTIDGTPIIVPTHIGMNQTGYSQIPFCMQTIAWTNMVWRECHLYTHMIQVE